jgi:glycine/D-amino acid oxidase-like deaminating enzyme
MAGSLRPCDAVIVGGGFYGTTIAAYLARRRGLRRIVLLEAGAGLLSRASLNNQARVHNGYHYPRSFTTAYRSRVNMPRFARDWPGAVRRDFSAVYAIARRNSKVTGRQFERFCREIGASIEPAEAAIRTLFEPRLVEAIFRVEEFAFDATVLADRAREELDACGVAVRLNTRATSISRGAGGLLNVATAGEAQAPALLEARHVFNCTYSGLRQLAGLEAAGAGLKHEIAELALVRPPEALRSLAVTLMDGPFFSMMPFPPRGLHTLSHVRYTPHTHWKDSHGVDPYARLRDHGRPTRVERMVRDAGRYLPAVLDAAPADSLFEVKTVLEKNETDDGRPILFERHPGLPGAYSILGGKIDNIYDVLDRLDAEPIEGAAAVVHATSGALDG